MTFTIYEDVPAKALGKSGNELSWVEAGVYDVVRLVNEKALIVINDPEFDKQRLLTMVRLNEGTLSIEG